MKDFINITLYRGWRTNCPFTKKVSSFKDNRANSLSRRKAKKSNYFYKTRYAII